MTALEWLLEPDEPSVRYRTLTELLDQGGTKDTDDAKAHIAGSAPVKKLLGAMHPDGYWLQKNPRTGETVGDGAVYGSFGTTHFCLSYCAELGLDRSHPAVAKAAERYLGLQKDDGDWLGHYSCLYTYNIRTFIRLGYRDDPRVQKAIDLMLETVRRDGGYLCDFHEKPDRRQQDGQQQGRRRAAVQQDRRPAAVLHPKSCVRGAAKALLAFSELPEYWAHARCLQLVDYFLGRHGIYKSNDHTRFVNKDMEIDSFPIIWRTNVWEILYALGKMGYGRDDRLAGAWRVLDGRRDSSGRFTLDWTPAQCPWDVGRRGQPNKWVTLYSLLAENYRDAVQREFCDAMQ
jgi:hypothetical protein